MLSIALAFLGCNDDDGINQNNIDPDELFASFVKSVDQTNGKVDFINISANADSYFWTFGDGSSSIEINPSYIYEENGAYLVKLVATAENGQTASFEDSVSINVPDPITIPITFDDENVEYLNSTFNGASFAIVANPAPGGSNDVESNVGEITNSGANFEGVFFDLGTAMDLTTENTVTMNVWSETAVDVLLKLEEGTGDAIEVSASHTGSGWENLQFTFGSTDSYSRVTIFIDAFGTSAGAFYIDDIDQTFIALTEPETAAPTPTQAAADVISLFSDAYTDVTVDTWRTTWSVADFEDVMIAGNATKKYSNLDFVGIETVASTVDVTAMTHLHLDVWSADINTFTVRLVDFGADGAFDGGDDAQADVEDDMPARGEWISYDIPLSEFTELITSANLAQYILVGTPAGNTTIFVDNIYFYDENGDGDDGDDGDDDDDGGGGGTGEFPFDFEAGEVFTVFEEPEATVANVANPDASGINTSANVLRMTRGVGAAWYSGVVFTETLASPVIDLANGTVFKIKVYSPNAGVNFRFQLEGGDPDEATTPTFNIDQTVGSANTWVELTFDFTGIADASSRYTRFAIFPDYDASNQDPVAVEASYYIDDITQE